MKALSPYIPFYIFYRVKEEKDFSHKHEERADSLQMSGVFLLVFPQQSNKSVNEIRGKKVDHR